MNKAGISLLSILSFALLISSCKEQSSHNGHEYVDLGLSVKWGGNWRIPTKEELEELRTKCTWTSTTLNGVKGYSVTSNVDGYTDRSIFLPATGMRIRQWTENTDTIGRFWGNSIVTGDDYDAVYLDFDFSRGPGRFSIIRCLGQCVRPVCP